MSLPSGKSDTCDYCHEKATPRRIVFLVDLRTGMAPKMRAQEMHDKSMQLVSAKDSICRYICNECFPKLNFKIKEKKKKDEDE